MFNYPVLLDPSSVRLGGLVSVLDGSDVTHGAPTIAAGLALQHVRHYTATKEGSYITVVVTTNNKSAFYRYELSILNFNFSCLLMLFLTNRRFQVYNEWVFYFFMLLSI